MFPLTPLTWFQDFIPDYDCDYDYVLRFPQRTKCVLFPCQKKKLIKILFVQPKLEIQST